VIVVPHKIILSDTKHIMEYLFNMLVPPNGMRKKVGNFGLGSEYDLKRFLLRAPTEFWALFVFIILSRYTITDSTIEANRVLSSAKI